MSASNLLVRILETNRLIGINYKDWLKNLEIVLTSKKIGYVLDQDAPALLVCPMTEQRVALDKWMDDDLRMKYYVLASMSNKL